MAHSTRAHRVGINLYAADVARRQALARSATAMSPGREARLWIAMARDAAGHEVANRRD